MKSCSLGIFDELISKLESTIKNYRTNISINTSYKAQPWVTIELRDKIKSRNKYYRYKKKFKNDQYIQNKYKSYKKQVKELSISLKKNYFHSMLEKSISDPKKFWKFLKYATTNTLDTPKQRVTIKKNNIEIDDNKLISNEFNTYFTSTAHDTVSNIKSTGPPKLTHTIDEKFILGKVPIEVLSRVIRNLKSSASCGYISVSTKFVQFFAEKLTPIIMNLINECISQGKFPNILKIGKVVPVFKSGSDNEIKNYRPITILNVFLKKFEKYLHESLRNHLNTKNILSKYQFGFLSINQIRRVRVWNSPTF